MEKRWKNMKRAVVETLQRRKTLLLIGAVNSLAVFIILIFFAPTYEENDDFFMGLIAQGTYGSKYMPYVVYSNILYGYILKYLGMFAAGVNWYVVMQYLLAAAAIISIFYIISAYLPDYITIFLNIIFWFAAFWEQIKYIQFTRTAGLLAVAGFMLLWDSFIHSSKKSRFLGYVFCIFASAIRLEVFLLAMPFFVCFIMIVCLKQSNKEKKQLIQGLLIVIVAVGLLALASQMAYSTSEEWRLYQKYNQVRANLLDYGLPVWEENRSNYEAIGFTENDIYMLSRWFLVDNQNFSYENLSQMASWKKKEGITSFIRNTGGGVCGDFIHRNYKNLLFYIWIIQLILSIFSNKTCRIYALFNIVMVLGIYLYLYYIGRVLPRVEYAIFLSAIFSLLMCWLNDFGQKYVFFSHVRFSIKFIVGILVFCLIFLGIKYYDESTGTENQYWAKQEKTLEYLANKKESVYLLDILSFVDICNSYRPFQSVPNYFLSNFCFTGGWHSNAPFEKSLFDRLGLENPVQDLINKETVYYVKREGYDVDVELLYLQQNYNSGENCNIEACLVEEYGGFWIWQFVKKVP